MSSLSRQSFESAISMLVPATFTPLMKMKRYFLDIITSPCLLRVRLIPLCNAAQPIGRLARFWKVSSLYLNPHSPDEGGGAVVADEPQREADEDRCEGRQLWPLCHLPDGQVAVSRQMFAEILSLIARLRAPPTPA